MEDILNKITNQLIDQSKDAIDKMILSDIIYIYNGDFKNYDDYIEFVKSYNELAYSKNKIIDVLQDKKYTYFPQRYIITQKHFDFIMSLSKVNEIKDKIWACIELLNVDGRNTKKQVKNELNAILEVLK